MEVPLSLDQKQLIQHSVELKKELHAAKRISQTLQSNLDELVARQDRLRYCTAAFLPSIAQAHVRTQGTVLVPHYAGADEGTSACLGRARLREEVGCESRLLACMTSTLSAIERCMREGRPSPLTRQELEPFLAPSHAHKVLCRLLERDG
eukprot:762970-Hanusia_phi.AAC.7